MHIFVTPELLDEEIAGNMYEAEDLSDIPNCRKLAMMQSLNNQELNRAHSEELPW